MSALADELRRFWLPGLNTVAGHQAGGLPGVFAAQEYQIYSPIAATSAVLSFADWKFVTRAFAADCARMSSAAFESVEGIDQSRTLPKSLAWLVVRAYYSAFFAAHAICRMLGRSVTQLDGPSSAAISAIAGAFGMLPGPALVRGAYVCVADASTRTLHLTKTVADGAHEALWQDFSRLMRDTADKILAVPGATPRAQAAAAKLIELVAALTGAGAVAGGSWLSKVRNRVNYQHGFGAWFPYRERGRYFDSLFGKVDAWEHDPLTSTIWPQTGRELQRFIETTMMVVAICKEMCCDMSRRCPDGRSFQDYGALALLKQLKKAQEALAV